MHRTANILAVGDELILGQTLDTNTRHIASDLRDRGIKVIEHATVDDDLGLLAGAIRRLCASVDLLVITGGLGPTADDLTRQALAQASGHRLVEDAGAMRDLAAWYAGRSTPMPEPNRVQALRPEHGHCLKNANGTAPGLWCSVGCCAVLALPGPPNEMRPMLREELDARLCVEPGRVIATRQLQTFGMGESRVAELLGELMDRDRDPLIGTTASGGIVSVRFRSEHALSRGIAEGALDEAEAAVRERLGIAVLCGDGEADALARVVVGLLRERGETLGTVESCTGGGLGARVTAVAGSSEVFVGGLVTYTDGLKAVLAGVEKGLIEQHGAVSAPVAMAMAEGGLGALGCDFSVGITGIAGPSGGSEEKPVGTVWIAAAGGGMGTEARRFVFSGDRAAVRSRASMAALGLLRLMLLGESMELSWQLERLSRRSK